MTVSAERIQQLVESFGDHMSSGHCDASEKVRVFFKCHEENNEEVVTAEEREALFHALYNSDYLNSNEADEYATVEEIRIMMTLCGIKTYSLQLVPFKLDQTEE